MNEVVASVRIRNKLGDLSVWGSRMHGVWSCGRGSHVNWVSCDIFYFDLSIRHLESGIGKRSCIQTCRLAFKALETLTSQIILVSK